MTKIKILANDIIKQISAGPIILKPLFVVKELIENSLDAKATFISINISNGGKKHIIIRDNGEGISKSQLSLAITSHATSKLITFEDLININTLGFRGEALASISSISNFIIISKTKDQKIAWALKLNNIINNNYELYPESHPCGTTVKVNNIFFNIPIKLKLLNSIQTEFYLINNLIKQFALLYSKVSFELIHNKQLINFYKNYTKINNINNIHNHFINILGKELIDNLLEIEIIYKQIKIQAWISKFCSNLKKKFNIQYCYINNRLIFNNKIINHAILQAYYCKFKTNININPTYIIKIYMNNKDLDINIHPNKTKVNFNNIRLIHDLIYNMCLDKLNNINHNNFLLINKNNINNKNLFEYKHTLINTIDNNLFDTIDNYSNLYKKIYNNDNFLLKLKVNNNLIKKKTYFGLPLTLLQNKFLLTFNIDKFYLINLSKAEIYLKKIQLNPNIHINVITLTESIIININQHISFNLLIKIKNILMLFGINMEIINLKSLKINSIPLGLIYQNLFYLISNLILYISINPYINKQLVYDWLIMNIINKDNIWNNNNTNILLQELDFLNINILKIISNKITNLITTSQLINLFNIN